MTKLEKLLTELASFTPLPSDQEIEVAELEKYQSIIDEVMEINELKAIPYLINSFSIGEAFGVNWVLLHYLESLGVDNLYPHLVSALRGEHPGPKIWSMRILKHARNKDVIDTIKELITDPNLEVQEAAKITLDALLSSH